MNKFPKHSTNYILVNTKSYFLQRVPNKGRLVVRKCVSESSSSCPHLGRIPYFLYPSHLCMFSAFPGLSCLPLVAVASHLRMLPYFTVECSIHIHAPPGRLQVPARHTALWGSVLLAKLPAPRLITGQPPQSGSRSSSLLFLRPLPNSNPSALPMHRVPLPQILPPEQGTHFVPTGSIFSEKPQTHNSSLK